MSGLTPKEKIVLFFPWECAFLGYIKKKKKDGDKE